MGVVNVTPDSFSDGGVNFDPDDAAASARRMVAEGAAIVDIGGESTRPGSDGVSLDEELRRVVPVLERLAGEVPVSIDTAKAEVARRALALGAELVNDVTALRGDPELAGVVADAGCYLCLMHMQGEPRTMQVNPTYDDVASEVAAFLEERLRFAVDAGHRRAADLPRSRDRLRQDRRAERRARRAPRRAARARPSGARSASRARARSAALLGDAGARTGPLSASLAAAVVAYERGATILRVHDVKEHVEALTVATRFRVIVEMHGAGGLRPPRRRRGGARARPAVLLRRDARAAASRARTSSRRRVDYRAVRDAVREVSDAKNYKLIESLAAAAADDDRVAVRRRVGDGASPEAGNRVGRVDGGYRFAGAAILTFSW